MQRLVYILIILLIGVSVRAQSDFDLSQRWFNEAIYNPAATGNAFTTSVFVQLRRQWLGLDKAPFTGAVSGDVFMEKISSAVGFSFNADKVGFTQMYNARFAYAYYIPLSENRSVLSLGLSASLLNRNIDVNDALIVDPDDPILPLKNKSEFNPDFDFGIEYQGLFKFGIVMRHLLTIKETEHFPKHSRNLWAYASSRFNLTDKISIEPTVSYTLRDNISRFEAGSIFYFLRTNSENRYNDKIWAGAMYRFNDQFSIMAGVHVTPQIRIGYSFDHAFRNLGYLSRSGTHEIFLSWQFNRKFYKEKRFYQYDQLNYEKGKGVKKDRSLFEQFQ